MTYQCTECGHRTMDAGKHGDCPACHFDGALVAAPKRTPEWVVRLPPWLAALVEAVPHGERGRRLEQHCTGRASKAAACDAGAHWAHLASEAWASWYEAASVALATRSPAPPHPLAEIMPRVPLGRLSPEVKAELARRAAWAGVRTEDYACGVILSSADN